MKKIILIPAISLLLSLPLQAAEEHKHDDVEALDGGMQPSEMMGMMSHEKMAGMQKHMQEMQSTMIAIKQEKDPAMRDTLMQQHMKSMNEAMQSMGGSKMGMMGDADMSSMTTGERMSMMQNQMGMMQMMVEQMMLHMSQKQ